MVHTKKSVGVLINSLLLTLLIFGAGMALNYSFDFFRINSIVGILNEHEIDSEAYMVHTEFISAFGGDKCDAMRSRIEDLKREMKIVGDELSSYGKLSFFKKGDFDYLKRKHFLLQLKFLTIIRKLNKECEEPYVPILFFFEIDHDLSERQGYILSEINLQYPQEIIVLSFDKNYEGEPLTKMLVGKYNITKAPTTIIGDDVKLEGIHYGDYIRGIISEIILDHRIRMSDYDMSYVLKFTETDVNDFAESMASVAKQDVSDFAKGDIHLIMGRILENKTLFCESLEYFENAEAQSREEEAIIHETIASIGCGADRKKSLLKAARIWRELGVEFRADIDEKIAYGDQLGLEFETYGPFFSPEWSNATEITIGSSYAELDSNDILVSQADRVTRDWLSYQIYSSPYSGRLLTVFSERLTYTNEELLPEIGWHEGARIKEMKASGLTHLVASGTMIARKGQKWYAPDEIGVFRFEVPIDKVLYPTTRFLTDSVAVMVDTHGINTIVEQAVRNNATAVVGCCDHIAKIKASRYLAEKGINVICFTDKYLPLVLGQNLSIFGSPPVKMQGGKALIGGSPITISTSEPIVAGDISSNSEAQSYYDTPARYFRNLAMMADINVTYVPLSRTGEMQTIVEKAEETGADVVGVRVFNLEDYKWLRQWLMQDSRHRAVLFHSTAYPHGYKIFSEFPEQTSFDDIMPVFSS